MFLSVPPPTTCMLVSPADRLLQPPDQFVYDSAGYVHGNVRHWEFESPAALSFPPQANWRRDELWLPHGPSHGTGSALSWRRQVRCKKCFQTWDAYHLWHDVTTACSYSDWQTMLLTLHSGRLPLLWMLFLRWEATSARTILQVFLRIAHYIIHVIFIKQNVMG